MSDCSFIHSFDKDEEAGDESFDSIPSSPIRAKPKIPPVLTLQQYARIKTAKIRCLKLVIGLLERFHGVSALAHGLFARSRSWYITENRRQLVFTRHTD